MNCWGGGHKEIFLNGLYFNLLFQIEQQLVSDQIINFVNVQFVLNGIIFF